MLIVSNENFKSRLLYLTNSCIVSANTKPRASLLQDRPCVHFVHREEYITLLQKFFHPFNDSIMMFVLSGMAGVGYVYPRYPFVLASQMGDES